MSALAAIDDTQEMPVSIKRLAFHEATDFYPPDARSLVHHWVGRCAVAKWRSILLTRAREPPSTASGQKLGAGTIDLQSERVGAAGRRCCLRRLVSVRFAVRGSVCWRIEAPSTALDPSDARG